MIDSRREAWLDEQQSKVNDDKKKRDSLAFRLETWRKHKQIDEDFNNDEKDVEKGYLLSRYEDWKDIEEYKKQQQQRDRDSLQGRLEKWYIIYPMNIT